MTSMIHLRLVYLCLAAAMICACFCAAAEETGSPGEDFGERLRLNIVERELLTKGFSGSHSHPGFFSDKGVLQDVCVKPSTP